MRRKYNSDNFYNLEKLFWGYDPRSVQNLLSGSASGTIRVLPAADLSVTLQYCDSDNGFSNDLLLSIHDPAQAGDRSRDSVSLVPFCLPAPGTVCYTSKSRYGRRWPLPYREDAPLYVYNPVTDAGRLQSWLRAGDLAGTQNGRSAQLPRCRPAPTETVLPAATGTARDERVR